MIPGMSIRMKEWGMMGTPGGGPHLPVQGLVGWDSVAEKAGGGISSVLLGSAELVRGQERVQQTGELAAFSDRLRTIGDETRAELSDCNVKDWDYAWRAASEPRLAEAVAELPPAARQAGMELARAYNRQAAVEALRDRSVKSLEKARGQWHDRVERSVGQGDDTQALQWLEQGKGVFIPEGEVEEAMKDATSRACLSRWRQGLQQDATGTLERWESAAAEDLPTGEKERRQLSDLMGGARRSAQKTLAQHASQELQAGRDIPSETWRQAQSAGLLSKAQYKRLIAGSPRDLSPADACLWFRRVDEVEDNDDARHELRMEICTSPLPVARRGELLKRLDSGASVNREDRLTLSRHLWNLYNRGAFGCPGDAPACRHMANLQRQGLEILAGEGTDAAARWVESRRHCDGRWVCFSDSRKDA